MGVGMVKVPHERDSEEMRRLLVTVTVTVIVTVMGVGMVKGRTRHTEVMRRLLVTVTVSGIETRMLLTRHTAQGSRISALGHERLAIVGVMDDPQSKEAVRDVAVGVAKDVAKALWMTPEQGGGERRRGRRRRRRRRRR
jgi:hypothetical protein